MITATAPALLRELPLLHERARAALDQRDGAGHRGRVVLGLTAARRVPPGLGITIPSAGTTGTLSSVTLGEPGIEMKSTSGVSLVEASPGT